MNGSEKKCECDRVTQECCSENSSSDHDDPVVFCIRKSDVQTWIKKDPNGRPPLNQYQLALLPSAFKEAIWLWATVEFNTFMSLMLETVSEGYQQEYYPDCTSPVPVGVGLFE